MLTAKRAQQTFNKMKNPICILFVDLTSAFDHMERSWLFKSIRNMFQNNSKLTLLQIIESLCTNTTTSLAENPDDKIELTTRVRQGRQSLML